MATRSLSIDIEVEIADAKRRLDAMDRALDDVGNSARASGREVSGFQRITQTAAGTFAGFISAAALMRGVSAAFRFTSEAVVGMNASLETAELQFATLTGSTTRAKQIVTDLFEFAERTPFETGPIIEASRIMQTFGGDALNTKENLMLIGDAAAGTTAPINELGMWVGRLFAALQGGQPIGEATLRLMELGVVTPQTVQQMRDMQEAGASGAETFAFFQEEIGRFSGAMEAQAGTWEGLTSTLQDSVNLLLADAFRPLFDALKVSVGQLNDWVAELSDSGIVVVKVAEAIGILLSSLDFLLRAVDFTQQAFRTFQTLFNEGLVLLFKGGIVVLETAAAYVRLRSVIDFMNRDTHQRHLELIEFEIFKRREQITALRQLSADQQQSASSTGNAITVIRGHITQLGEELNTYSSDADVATASTETFASAIGGGGGGGGGGGRGGSTTATKALQGLTLEVRNASAAVLDLLKTQGLSTFGWQTFNAQLLETNTTLLPGAIGLIPTVESAFGNLSQTMNPPGGFFRGVLDSFESLKTGLTGGNGIVGFFENLGHGIVDGFGQIISGGLSSLINAGVNLAMRGLSAFANWLGGLFGPSEAELAGREAFAAYRDSVVAELNQGQIAEAMAAGWANPDDAALLIHFRDTLREVGLDASVAEGLFNDMVDAIERGPGAVQAVIDRFERLTQGVGNTATAGEVFSEELQSAEQSILQQMQATQRQLDELNASMGEDAPEQSQRMRDALISDLRSLEDELAQLRTQMERPAIMPLQFDIPDMPRLPSIPSFPQGGLVQAFPTGGLVNHIPALVEPGEFVMSRPAVNRIGVGNLASMNAGGGGGMTVNVSFSGGMFMDSPSSQRKLADLVSRRIMHDLTQKRRVGALV